MVFLHQTDDLLAVHLYAHMKKPHPYASGSLVVAFVYEDFKDQIEISFVLLFLSVMIGVIIVLILHIAVKTAS